MKNTQIKTRSLIEGGLTVAFVVMLVMINMYLPLFGSLGNFILPIPLTLLYLRHNFKTAIWSVFSAGLLLSVMINPLTGLSTACTYGVVGIILGNCIKKQRDVSITFMYLCIGLLISTILKYYLYFLFIDTRGVMAVVNDLSKAFKESIHMGINMYSKMGIPKESLEPLNQIAQFTEPKFILRLIPAAIITSSFISGFINYQITKLVLNKMGYKNIKSIGPFSKIHVNIKLVTITSILLLIGILLNRRNIGAGNIIYWSSAIILGLMFALDGISLAVYYLRNKFKISKGIVVFLIIFTINSKLSFIYIYIGLFDVILDIRKLDPNRNKNRGGI